MKNNVIFYDTERKTKSSKRLMAYAKQKPIQAGDTISSIVEKSVPADKSGNFARMKERMEK